MITFKEWIEVAGRGWIALCKCDDPTGDWEFLSECLHTRTRVKIVDKLYTITGVEGTFPRGVDIGIVIRGLPWSGEPFNYVGQSPLAGSGTGSQTSAPDGAAID